MKKQEITQVFMYLLMMIVGGVLLMSLFVGCNVYEHEEAEIIRCPQIQDTVQIPDWNEQGSDPRHSKKLNN